MNTSLKLKVALVNLDNITRNALRFFLDSGLSPDTVPGKSIEEARLLIVDSDRRLEDGFLESLKTRDQYAIVLHNPADGFADKERLFGLGKPVQQNELKKIIDRVLKLVKDEATASPESVEAASFDGGESPALVANHTRTPSSVVWRKHAYSQVIHSNQRIALRKYVGTNPDVDLENSRDLNQIYITPEKYLYYHLSNARKLAGRTGFDIQIDTTLGKILYEHSSQKFYSFDWMKLKHSLPNPLFAETRLTRANPDSGLRNSDTTDSIKTVWESALLASKGRLPKGTCLDSMIKIIYQPDFSSLIKFEHMDRIISFWAQDPVSLKTTVTQLDVPQRFVFSLFCAMQAVSGLRIEADAEDKGTDPDPYRSGNPSVFSKLLKHITRH